jgi:cardiolipin synthase (CMP-forming)
MANRILVALPNMLTLLRLVLIIPVVYLCLTENYLFALIVFAIAAASDGLDGFIARKYNLQSRFGTIADPIADKLLGFAVSLVFTIKGHCPIWLFVLMISRDVIIIGGGLLYQYLWGAFIVKPLLLSKINTATQSFILAFVMFNLAFNLVSLNFIDNLWLLLTLTTAISGGQYIWIWGCKATEKSRIENNKE